MTYKELILNLTALSQEQLDKEVTVELGPENVCYAAELRICAEEHSCLAVDYPVIFAP